MKSIIVSALLLANTSAFSPVVEHAQGNGRLNPLFMGRAAAVRAATKSKTDGKKAKINAVFGKRIIMAVKQVCHRLVRSSRAFPLRRLINITLFKGGSPDPNANRMLGDIIKQAKQNSVPVDNINRAIKRASEGNAGDFSESTFEVSYFFLAIG
jgi:transcriptional/translational regulatory protein YebC/TACO1